MRQKGRLCSPRSGEKIRPFLATETIVNKCKDTFTSANSFGRASWQGPGNALIVLSGCFALVKIIEGKQLRKALFLMVFRLSVCFCSTATHDPITRIIVLGIA